MTAENAEFMELLQSSQDMWALVAERLNLVVALRSYPVGIFSLLSSIFPIKTPVGDPLFLEVFQPGNILLIFVAFLLVGMVLGSLYYAGVYQAALYDEIRWRDVVASWPWLIKHTLVLGLIWLSLFVGVTLLGACLITGAALVNPGFAQVAFMLVLMAYIWLMFPLFFSPHGIFVERKTAWRSVYSSLRMTNVSFLQTGFFILIAVLITQGLDVIWQVPPEDSWLMLISIAGHAFVSTGVLAASFVYYQDLSRWIQEIIAWREGELSLEM